MGTYTVQKITRAGITPSFAAVAASDQFVCPNDKRTYLEVINAGGTIDNVGVAPVQTKVRTEVAGDIDVDAIAVAVPITTGRKKIGPFPPAYINAGLVTVTHSFTTSVTAGAFYLPNE